MRIATGILLLLPTLASAASPTLAPRPEEEALIRRLVDALKDVDPEVRQNVALSLAKIGVPAIDSLVEALKDPLAERRSGAAYALALIGPAAKSAMPALLDALEDKDTDVRRQASYAISRILPPSRPAPEVTGPGRSVQR